MKSLLSIAIAVFVSAPIAFADDKCCDDTKAAAAKAKAGECSSTKKSGPKETALRLTLLTHKGALLAKR